MKADKFPQLVLFRHREKITCKTVEIKFYIVGEDKKKRPIFIKLQPKNFTIDASPRKFDEDKRHYKISIEGYEV